MQDFEHANPRDSDCLWNLLFMKSFEGVIARVGNHAAAAAVQSRVPESLIKPYVYWESWIRGSTGPGLLIKPVVYAEFWTCKSKGTGLLIKPVVYEEFWRRVPKGSESLMEPVVYEESWTCRSGLLIKHIVYVCLSSGLVVRQGPDCL